MKIIGNLLWWLFGGLEAAFGYFTGHVMKFNEQVSGAIESFPIDNLTMKCKDVFDILNARLKTWWSNCEKQ